MKLRTAIPILAASFTIMLVGLGLANAQEVPEGEEGQRPPPPPPMPGVEPILKQQLGDDVQRLKGRIRPRPAPTPAPFPDAPPSPQPVEPGNPGDPPEADPTCQAQSPRGPVMFNLEDSDLPDLIRLISNITCKRFILPGGKAQRELKATIIAPTKVTTAEAYSAFLSILAANGMTVTPVGRYLKVITTEGVERNPLPTYRDGSATPGDERFVTRMYRVDNVSATDVVELIERFKSPEGNISAYAPTNTVIMTDTGTNIRRMVAIVEAVDVPSGGEQVWIEPIHYANATELAERLREIFPVGEGGSGATSAAERPTPPRPRRPPPQAEGGEVGGGGSAPETVGSRAGARISNIIADERTNSLIIMATERAYLRVLEMIRRLDVPIEGEGRIHVHYLQNGDAEDIASTLTSLISGSGASTSKNRQPRAAAATEGAPAASGGGDIFEGQIRVTAHVPTNSLVITSSAHDYAAMRRVIERLDAPRRQVFLEAVIMELSIRRTRDLGLSFHGGVPDVPLEGSILGFGNSGLPNTLQPVLGAVGGATLHGLALGVQGPDIEGSADLLGQSVPSFGIVMNAVATSGDVNVLSTPHIIAMNNEPAKISVGENIPLQTSGANFGNIASLAGAAGSDPTAAANPLASLAGLGGLSQQQPRQDVGVDIEITPYINDSNEIRMKIKQQVSELGSREGALGAASINKRSAETTVMVRDQQTVVIGGMIRESTQSSETKIPVLGDIPLLGALFRRTTTTKQRNNLLLFLTPYIIRDHSDLRAIFQRKMQDRQEFIDRYFVFGDNDYEPIVDWSRTRGLVSEIFNEMDDVLEERALIEEARARAPLEHVPRPPVGSATLGDDAAMFDEGDLVIEPDDGGTEIPHTAIPDIPDIPPEQPPDIEGQVIE